MFKAGLRKPDLMFRKASHIDFVHKKRHMDMLGGWGLAPVTFLGEKSREISTAS